MCRRRAIDKLVAALVLLLATSTAAAGEKYALIVGSNEGLPEDPTLQFAESDAQQFARTLVEVGVTRESNVQLAIGRSLPEILAAVHQLSMRATRDDVVLIFFSGHGDARGAHLAGKVWSWSQIRSQLEALQAHLVIAFFDACRSGAVLTARGIVRGPPLAIAAERIGPEGRFLVTSSGSNEFSYESALLGSSPFSLYLRSGLRGAADGNNDGSVTLTELYSFVYERTLAATLSASTGPQHPTQLLDLKGAGEVVLAHVSGARIWRASRRLGACYFLDKSETRVVAELGDGGAASVSLPKGEYSVKCIGRDGTQAARMHLTGEGLRLDDLAFHPMAQSFALAKGSNTLLAHRWELAIALFAGLRGELQPGGALRYRLLSGDFAFHPELIGTPHFLLPCIGIGGRFPWWHALGSRLEMGLELGIRIPLVSAGATPPAVAIDPFVQLDFPLAHRTVVGGRLEFLSLYPLRPNMAPAGAVLISIAIGLELAPR